MMTFSQELRSELTELARGKLDQDDREAIKKDGVFWRQTRSGKTIGIDPKDGSVDAGHPKVLKKLKKAGAAIGRSSFAKGAKAGFKKSMHHGHDDDHGGGKKKETFFGKLKAKSVAAAKAIASMPSATKKLFTDKNHRKEVLSKESLTKGANSVAEFAGKAVGRTVGHMAHEGVQAKDAAKALWNIRNTKVSDLPKTWKSMSKADKKAIKGTAKAIAMTVGGTAAMGHFGVLALMEHFVAESAIVGAIMAHQLRHGYLLTEAEAEAQMAKVLEHVINRLDDVAKMSDDELADLLAKVMDYRDDSPKKESVMFQSDNLHDMRVLSGIRPTRPSLTEARSGITAHERQARRDALDEAELAEFEEAMSLKDQHADALKRAKRHPKSGWKKHAAKIKKKMQAWSDVPEGGELAESDAEIVDGLAKLIKQAHSQFARLDYSDLKKIKEIEGMLRSRARMLAPHGSKPTLKQQREIIRKAFAKADPKHSKKFFDALSSYKAPKRKKRPTFKAAKAALLQHLDKEGWTVKSHLKVPHATDPYKDHRLYFKSQAVYLGGAHTGASLGDARSLHIDIRDVTPEEFMQHLKRWTR